MRAEVRVVAALASGQDGVVTSRQAAAAGVSPSAIRTSVARGDWVPLLRGAYLTQSLRTGPALTRSWARAAALTVPGGVVAFETAAALQGLSGAPRTGRVHVVAPP